MSNNDSSGSDFDDDDDPDKIEVPGGGKDLATAAGFNSEAKAKIFIKEEQPPMMMGAQMRLPNKIPGGLVTKGNSQPGFEMVRGSSSELGAFFIASRSFTFGPFRAIFG